MCGRQQDMDDVALVMGEALVDVVSHDTGAVPLPGGSSANCAVALSRLGRLVWLSTCWGTDPHGDLLEQHLNDNGVGLAGDPRRAARTSSALASLGADGSAKYDFDIIWEPGPVVLPADVTVVVVAYGSLGAVLQPGAAVVRAEVAHRRATALTYYDLNVRPQVTGVGQDVVAGAETMAGLAHLVKGSDEDLASLWPDRGEDEVAHRVFDLGCSALVVTKGASGATWWSPDGRVDVEMVPVRVLDTIGAGDTFGAAMLDSLWSLGAVGATAGQRLASLGAAEVQAVLVHAAAAAAVTVSRVGADPPHAADLR